MSLDPRSFFWTKEKNMANDNKMITTKDIAQAAGVSQTAVSAVLSGKSKERRIGDATAAKIIEAAKRLGYRRNLAAHELRSGRSSSIGILLPAPMNNIYSHLVGALGPILERYGYLASFAFWQNENYQKQATESILCRCPSGIITVEPRLIPDNITCPVVSLITKDPRFDLVCFDGEDIFTQVIQHLYDLGHRRIAYSFPVLHGEYFEHLTARFAGELASRGLSTEWIFPMLPKTDTIHRESLQEFAKYAADKFESFKERPSAFVFNTDTQAAYFMHEITSRGYVLPRDLSITGCDNTPITNALIPSLTTFGENPDDPLAERLVTALLTRMEQPDSPRKIYRVKRKLIVRDSTAQIG